MSVAKNNFVTRSSFGDETYLTAALYRREGMNYLTKFTINQYTPTDNNPLAGMVMIHETAISPATLQRTLLNRSDAPTPIIAELTICDMLTGTPKRDAARMTIAEVNCVEKLWSGRIL